MAYLTQDQYAAYGGQLPAVAFIQLELKSRKRIDRLTDCRVQAMAEAGNVPEAVQLCMVALIELESKVGTTAQVNNPSVTSFSTDGYTEQYGNLPDAATADAQMDKLVKEYLYGEVDNFGVPLLYRGV
jgi:hypothetical protein